LFFLAINRAGFDPVRHCVMQSPWEAAVDFHSSERNRRSDVGANICAFGD
jgi:hypothetical protein